MRIFIALLLLTLMRPVVVAQDTTGTVVILSDQVGPIIDLEERNYYGMFLSVQHFESAVLLQRPDSSYIFKIITKKEDETSIGVLWFSQTKEAVESIRQIIEPNNGIECEAPQSSGSTPNLSIVRISGQFLAGILMSTGFSVIGEKTIGSHDGEDSGLLGAIVGVLGGAVVGSSLGVYIIGNIGDQTGSYVATLLGSTLGMGLGMGVSLAMSSELDNVSPLIILCTLPTLSGIMGFNSSLRYKKTPASGSAIINLKDSRMSLGIPRIYFRLNPFDRMSMIQNIDLVQVDF